MKVAVITGAGSGLGRVFATALAAEGWTIVALGRTEETLQATIALLPEGEHGVFICDISDAAQVEATFEQIVERYDRVDLLLNNAGFPGALGRIDLVEPQQFASTINTNFLGTVYCSQQAFGIMAKRGGGRIINNGSIAAHAPRPQAAAYAASKAAVASLTKSLNLDGRGLNIVATELDIGNAQTELLANFSTEEPHFDAAEAGAIVARIAALPLTVTADQVTITASGMPYLGRG